MQSGRDTVPKPLGSAGRRLAAFGVVAVLMWAGALALLAVPPAPSFDGRGSGAVGPRLALPVPILLDGVSPSAASLGWIESLDLCFREYELQYSDSGAMGPWTTWATYPDRSTTWAFVHGFGPAATYWWQLVDRACDGTEAATQVVVTQSDVASLSYTIIDDQTVQFSWDNKATYGGHLAFESYQLMESVNGGPYQVEAFITDVAMTTYTISGLSSSNGYTFYVLTTDVCPDCASGTPPSPSASNAVTFGAPQPVGATADASAYAVDVGQSVSFRCVASGGTPPYDYTWDFGDGGSATGPSTSHTYASPGPVRATCTVRDGASGQATASVDLTVSPAPTVVASVDHPAAAPGTLLQFAADASGGPGTFTSYAWAFGDGSTDSGSTVAHAYGGEGAFTASVVVTDGNGGTASDTVVVSITAVSVSGSASTTHEAPGRAIAFNAWASGGAHAPYAFTWDFGDGSGGSGTSVSHAYASPGNYSPVVTATDSLGASDTANLPTIMIEEGGGPGPPGGPLSVAFAYTPSAPVAGELVAFTAFPRGGAGGYSCAWDFGNGTGAPTCTSSHTWSSPGLYNVTVTATDANGTRATSQAAVRVSARLVVRVEMSPESPAVGESATFTAVPAGGSGTYVCAWTFGDSDRTVAGCQVSHAWDKAGSYLVSVRVSDSENRQAIGLRSVDIPAANLVSGANLLLLIPAAIALGVALHVWLQRRGGVGPRNARRDAGEDPPDPALPPPLDDSIGTESLGISVPPADPHLVVEPPPGSLLPSAAVRRDTMPAALPNRDAARAFLHMDPVGTAVVWDRAFQQPDVDVYTEGRPIRGVIAVHRTTRQDGANFVALHALDLDAASALCGHLPSGFTLFHLTEEFSLSLLAHRADEFHPRPAWLFELDERAFIDHPDDRVRPLEAKWAGRIAKLWQPEWPAEAYVRHRIEDGPTAAVYEGGEPIAWALTHLVTDRVGIIGMVHVVEAHRRKGLAKVVTAAVVRDLLRSGKIPALHAYVDNAASLALFPTLGFRKVKRQVWGEAVFRAAAEP